MPKILVEYKGLNIYRAAGIRFLPGNNRIDAEAWEKAQELAGVRHRIHEKILVETKGDETPAEDFVPPAGAEKPEKATRDGLDGFNAKDAVAKVKNTIDPSLLAYWAETEGRKTVLEAITAQLAAIDPANKDTTGGDGEGKDA